MNGEARFEELCADLLARNGDLVRTKMMGMPSLKLNGTLVAGFAATEDAMVFKLPNPDDRSRALALPGAHLFEPMEGRAMKEWVVVTNEQAQHWPAFAQTAIGT